MTFEVINGNRDTAEAEKEMFKRQHAIMEAAVSASVDHPNVVASWCMRARCLLAMRSMGGCLFAKHAAKMCLLFTSCCLLIMFRFAPTTMTSRPSIQQATKHTRGCRLRTPPTRTRAPDYRHTSSFWCRLVRACNQASASICHLHETGVEQQSTS